MALFYSQNQPQTLEDWCLKIVEAPNQNETFALVKQALQVLLPSTSWVLRLWKKERNRLEPVAFSLRSPSLGSPSALALGRGWSGRAALLRQLLCVAEVLSSSEWKKFCDEEYPQAAPASFLATPLESRGELLGVLAFERLAQQTPFHDDDQKTARALAVALSMALAYLQSHSSAYSDAMTDLGQVRSLMLRLEEELSRALRFGDPVALVMLDIDHFKKFNDQHGHLTGDAVLKFVAQTLKRGLRAQDFTARYGGEEFAVLLPGALDRDAAHVAQRLRQTIAEQLCSYNGRELSVTASFGVAVAHREAGLTCAELLHRADQALYASKESGRNRVTLWAPTLKH